MKFKLIRNILINKENKTSEENIPNILKESISALESLENWDNDSLFKCLSGLSASLDLKKNAIMWVVRIAISGQEVTPGGATEILEILGKNESLSRLRKSLELWN